MSAPASTRTSGTAHNHGTAVTPRSEVRPEFLVVRRDVRIAAARRRVAVAAVVAAVQRAEKVALLHAAQPFGKVRGEARALRVGGVTARALRLKTRQPM